ncbi:MAG: DMT family transporter [Thermoleophilia bacterium]
MGLTAGAVGLMLLLCALWGANFVAIKVGNRGFPPLLAAGLRSVGAAVLVGAWALLRGQSLGGSRRLWLHGVATGFLFALEFLFLYGGSVYTSASRAILLVYTSPFWVALGAHVLLPGDRLRVAKSAGLALSFLGVVAVFRAPGGGLGPDHLRGDLLEVLAAVSWAATTLYVKRYIHPFGVGPVPTLFYQLAFSAPILLAAAAVAGQVQPSAWRLDSVTAVAYQTVVVATFSYLAWFWLLQRNLASLLHSFTFFAPLFGVIFGGLFLGDHLPLLLWVGLALVAGGTYLVNRPAGLPSGP